MIGHNVSDLFDLSILNMYSYVPVVLFAHLHVQLHVYVLPVLLYNIYGGSMIKLSACRTHNPKVLSLSPTLTTGWILFSVVLSETP